MNRNPGAARRSRLARVAFTHLERIAPEVVAVQFDRVKGIEKHGPVMLAVPNAVEARHAVIAAGDCLAVDDAGRERRQASASTMSVKR